MILILFFFSFQAKLNALKTVVLLQPRLYVPSIVEKTLLILKELSLIQVTREEYQIFLTPEGELYDTTVIEK